MKNLSLQFLLVAAAASSLSAQPFNSGSDGSYGAINITNNATLAMPANGIFNCTTITVASGATLTFTKNVLNTPVYLLASGNVVINGTIDLSGGANSGGAPGLGGPGGFDGGTGGFGTGGNGVGGDGAGPGGGKINTVGYAGAVYAQSVNSNTNTYGNALLSPLIGGSGGAGSSGNPGYGGGSGGGAILIAANTSITVNGSINCNAGSAYIAFAANGAGSGGGIRIVAPVINGSGSLNASSVGTYDGYSGSYGRIRVDCQDNYAFRSLSYNGVATRGTQMFVFPPTVPTLAILQAAGQIIPEGTNNSVIVNLPPGSPTNQTVTVQARNFTNNVPIVVSVVPENRPSSNYLATITLTNNPSQTTVNVVIPSGTYTHIYSWTQ